MVYSAFSPFTNRFLIFIICFVIDLVLCLFYSSDKVAVISMHYFLWDAAFHLFNQSEIYVSAIYWFFLHLILYVLESSVEVQCEEWITDTASLR